MNTIEPVNVPCQLQPNDLSFLSQADAEILKMIEGVLLYGFNLNDKEKPIIVQGLKWASAPTANNQVYITITSGLVLRNGLLYSVEGVSNLVFVDLAAAKSRIKLVFTDPVVVSPSPVYDAKGSKTINRHYCYKATLQSGGSQSDNVVNFTNGVQRLPYYDTVNSEVITVGD